MWKLWNNSITQHIYLSRYLYFPSYASCKHGADHSNTNIEWETIISFSGSIIKKHIRDILINYKTWEVVKGGKYIESKTFFMIDEKLYLTNVPCENKKYLSFNMTIQ